MIYHNNDNDIIPAESPTNENIMVISRIIYIAYTWFLHEVSGKKTLRLLLPMERDWIHPAI